jgi:hypothetical protein
MKIKNNVLSRLFLALFFMLGAYSTTHAGVTAPTFGDLVWDDLDGNGALDDGEPGIEGVTVQLCDVGAGGNANCGLFSSSALTDANGFYSIDGTPSLVSYWVIVDTATAPTGFTATTPTSILYSGVFGGDEITDADFGFKAVPVPAAIWLFGSGLLGLLGVARRNRIS